jgi:hypothetical protein
MPSWSPRMESGISRARRHCGVWETGHDHSPPLPVEAVGRNALSQVQGATGTLRSHSAVPKSLLLECRGIKVKIFRGLRAARARSLRIF